MSSSVQVHYLLYKNVASIQNRNAQFKGTSHHGTKSTYNQKTSSYAPPTMFNKPIKTLKRADMYIY